MTPNEYVILRFLGDKGSVTVRQVALHLRNSDEYTRYLCAGMVKSGLLEELLDDSGKKPKRAYRLTPKSSDMLTDLWRGMEDNLRLRAARFYRVGAIVEGRANQLGEKARSFDLSDENASAPREKIPDQ